MFECYFNSKIQFPQTMVYSIIFKIFARYSNVLVLPVCMAIGIIGYKVEGWISDRYTPSLESVKDQRAERLLNEEKEVDSLKDHKFVPKTIFEKNLSPSLMEQDPRLKKNGKTT